MPFAVLVATLGSGGAMAQVPSTGAVADVRDSANRTVATAEFREGRGEVQITISFPNPPLLSGTHAIHILENGRCDGPDYTSAGNILNPLNKKHGRQNPAGFEVGDLPNVNFSTGLTSYNTTSVGATLGGGSASLLTPNRSLVIFSGEDDQQTDPDGKAGSRIACGVITASSGAAPAVAPGVSAGSPTPTPAIAQTAPRIASPVPVQQQQPISPAQAAGQPVPVSKPGAASPVVVPKPVVVNNSASPVAVAGAAQPTPIIIATAPAGSLAAASTQSANSSGMGGLTALIIAVLGVGLVLVGYLLRRRSELTR